MAMNISCKFEKASYNIFFVTAHPKEKLFGGSVTVLKPKYPLLSSGDTITLVFLITAVTKWVWVMYFYLGKPHTKFSKSKHFYFLRKHFEGKNDFVVICP